MWVIGGAGVVERHLLLCHVTCVQGTSRSSCAAVLRLVWSTHWVLIHSSITLPRHLSSPAHWTSSLVCPTQPCTALTVSDSRHLVIMVALCNRADHYIFILFLTFFLLLLFFPRLISAVGATWCGLSANLECRCEMQCTRLAANTGRKKSLSRHHCTDLSGHIFATKACIDNRKKTC